MRSEEVDSFRGRSMATPEMWMIIVKYAARSERGKVLRCDPLPGEAELAYFERRELAHDNGKVVYPSKKAAQQAAEEMEAVGNGPSRAYECKRGGHAHLTQQEVWVRAPASTGPRRFDEIVLQMTPEEIEAKTERVAARLETDRRILLAYEEFMHTATGEARKETALKVEATEKAILRSEGMMRALLKEYRSRSVPISEGTP